MWLLVVLPCYTSTLFRKPSFVLKVQYDTSDYHGDSQKHRAVRDEVEEKNVPGEGEDDPDIF